MINEKLLNKLLTIRAGIVDYLQDNTDLAEILKGYGIPDTATENNPSGDYAVIENWLTSNGL